MIDHNIYEYIYDNYKYKIQESENSFTLQYNNYILCCSKINNKHIMLSIDLSCKDKNILMDILYHYCNLKNYTICCFLNDNTYNNFLIKYGVIINDVFISIKNNN